MPKNKILIIAVAVIIIIVALVIWYGGRLTPQIIIGEEIDLERVGMFGKQTEFGFVNVPFVQKSEDLKFLNVVVDLNNDQKFVAYEANGKEQPEWLVQNMPARFIDAKNSFSFFFPDKTVDGKVPANGLALRAVLSKDAIADRNWDGVESRDAAVRNVRVKITFNDVGNLQSPAPGKDGGFGFLYSDGYSNFFNLALAQVEEINIFNPDVPDIDQGENECAPTSAANSLIWLAKKFEFEDKLPATPAELIGELKIDMNWANGINPNDFLPGKEAITQRRSLPLVNHSIGNFNGTGTFEAMAEELKRGQDVEMRIQYKDEAGNPTNGHWVTIVGLERMENGTMIIDVNDPLSQPGPSLNRYRLDNTPQGIRIANYPFGRAYVSFAVAESYVARTPPAATTPGPTDQPPTTERPATPRVEAPAIVLMPISVNFEHIIGKTSCPQTAGKITIDKKGGDAAGWKILSPIPEWLNVSRVGSLPGAIDVKFNCVLERYVTQNLSTVLDFQLLDEKNNPVGEKGKVDVKGSIIAR